MESQSEQRMTFWNRGFWFPTFQCFLDWGVKYLSLGTHFKRNTSNGTSARGATELYQLAWVVLLWLWLVHVYDGPSIFHWKMLQNAGLLALAYRFAEISMFALHWVFSDTAPKVHSQRRSLAMFILNLVEISLISGIVVALLGCSPAIAADSDILYEALGASFRVTLMDVNPTGVCSVVVHSQLYSSAVLLSVTVASLVGAVVRPTKDKEDA